MGNERDKEEKINRETRKVEINTPDTGYQPFPVSIMNKSTHEGLTFDPSLGKPATISYSLNKSGCIRIRIVRRDQQDLMLRTLQDWTDQEFGKYEVKWDGRDASGNIIDNKKVLIIFEARDQGKGRLHHNHNKELCHDPKLIFETNPESVQKLKGVFDIWTAFSGETPSDWDNKGYEVRYFIDYKPVKTERFEKGAKRFGFKIDTAGLCNGEHLITVNIDDLQDHIGSAGLMIRVEN